jgi:LPXTG-motif cell wall-anchored protein
MLALINTNASNALVASQRAGLTVPFGDLVFEISGELQGFDTSLGAGGTQANVRQVTLIVSFGVARANSGLNATVSVDSGSPAGAAAVAASDAAPGAVTALPGATSRALESSAVVSHRVDAITTGDAFAGNQSVTIICQRVQSDDVTCLAPPTTTVPTEPTTPTTEVEGTTPTTAPAPTTATTVPVGAAEPPAGIRTPTRQPAPAQASLPATGSDSGDLAAVAAGLVLLGAACLVLQRRRRPVR